MRGSFFLFVLQIFLFGKLTATPNLTVVPTASITCKTSSPTLHANSTTPNATFVWTGPGIVSGANTSSPVVNVAGTYTVVVTDPSDGTTASATVNVVVNTVKPVVSSTSPPGLPCGITAIYLYAITSNVNVIYTWTGPNIISGQGTDSVLVQGIGGYQVILEDTTNGCKETILFLVTPVPGTLTGSLIAQTNNLCYGGSAGSATVSGGLGFPPYSYTWSNGASGATATGLAAGNYTCTVTDSKGCTFPVSVTITQPNQIEAAITTTAAVCTLANGGATINATGGKSPYSFSWSTGGNGSSVSNLAAGNYSVNVTDANSCVRTFTFTISSTNTLTINAGPDQMIGLGTTTNVSLQNPQSGWIINWSPPTNLGCSTCPSTSASPLENTTYTVTVTDNKGCVATDQITILVADRCPESDDDIFISNIISPNGDGVDDEIHVIAQGVRKIDWRVFNRWGEMVFKSEHVTDGWNGYFRGLPGEDGVYVYYLKITCRDGTIIDKKGNITLLK